MSHLRNASIGCTNSIKCTASAHFSSGKPPRMEFVTVSEPGVENIICQNFQFAFNTQSAPMETCPARILLELIFFCKNFCKLHFCRFNRHIGSIGHIDLNAAQTIIFFTSATASGNDLMEDKNIIRSNCTTAGQNGCRARAVSGSHDSVRQDRSKRTENSVRNSLRAVNLRTDR